MSDNKNRQGVLAVIGGGPKAMALVAKAEVLRGLGFTVPQVVIIEKHEIGANWCGKHGFTDGTPTLRRPIERDIGFPYNTMDWSEELNAAINERMMQYSWPSYLISRNRYKGWVDRGRPQPSHDEFHEYLKWIAREAKADITYGTVDRISASQNEWIIDYYTRVQEQDGSPALKQVVANGVVITGPGTPKDAPSGLSSGDGYFDAVSYWQEWPTLKDTIRNGDRIGIIGAGDAAATIAIAVLDSLQTRLQQFLITIITHHGTIYSRGENYTETYFYSDPTGWDLLLPEQRTTFIDRTDRAVFSQQAQQRLNQVAHGLTYEAGTVQKIVKDPRASGINGRIVAALTHSPVGTELYRHLAFEYLIDSASFNRLSFLSLFDDSLRKRFSGQDNGDKAIRKTLEEAITRDLSIDGIVPKLHLPMFAAHKQGPGFPSLSCLGLLSDRILRNYVTSPSS